MNNTYWEKEAKMQAASAGELRIALAIRLDDIEVSIKENEKMLLETDNRDFTTQAGVLAKVTRLKNERDWIKSVLTGYLWRPSTEIPKKEDLLSSASVTVLVCMDTGDMWKGYYNYFSETWETFPQNVIGTIQKWRYL